MGMFFPWAIGEAIIVWRWAKAKAPPPPGVLLLASGLYLGLAIMAEYRPARPVAITFAYAVDLAILLQVVGQAPHEVTGWPPPYIEDPTVILPTSSSGTASGSSSSTAASSSGTPGPSGTQVA